jgi:MurE/MurF fusion protein
MRWRRCCRRCARWPRRAAAALWCVFGCGGNRDASKRPLMGAIAERLADRVVLTSDNPRDEKTPAPSWRRSWPACGGRRPPSPSSRTAPQAIAHAVAQAAAADVVLVAGKGHEDYQEVAGVRRPFSDAVAVAAGRASGPARMTARRGAAHDDAGPGACAAARLAGGRPAPRAMRVHSDTRTLQPGDLFVALRGERFDAHDFLPQARAAGAAAALAERGLAEPACPACRWPTRCRAAGTGGGLAPPHARCR